MPPYIAYVVVVRGGLVGRIPAVTKPSFFESRIKMERSKIFRGANHHPNAYFHNVVSEIQK
eukprot:scaffold33483_cov76-Amphora_coffeaeformis.AAC.1